MRKKIWLALLIVLALSSQCFVVQAAENDISFQMNRVYVYYTSSKDTASYLQNTTSSGGTSGVSTFGWGGFAIGLKGPLYANWQAGGVYNISSPALIDITVHVRDSNKNFSNGNLLLVTDKPSWKTSPSTEDFPSPHAGSGLIFWSGYSCGAYQIDTVHIDDYEDKITFHFAVTPPETYGLPYQDMFTFNLSWFCTSTVNFASNVSLTEWSCTNTTLAIVQALNAVGNAGQAEKEEANNQANSSVSQGEAAIADNSAAVTDGLSSFISGLSYNGTACNWTMPRVYIPAIAGVISETTLIESQPIDFEQWLDALPSGILTIMRSVCSVAIILYGFKEFYGLIEYVLTLRGKGGSDE